MNPKPKHRDIWSVDFDLGRESTLPSVGSEINKIRPAIVVNHIQSTLEVCQVIPITDWKDWYNGVVWHIPIECDDTNCLSKKSSADISQMRSVSFKRFKRYIGVVSEDTLDNVKDAIAVYFDL